MAHFPKLRRGPRRRRAAAAEDRRLAMETLQESLERLEELDKRVEALRAHYQPWLASRRGSSSAPSGSASPTLEHPRGVDTATEGEPRT
jgi:hypothetical protein